MRTGKQKQLRNFLIIYAAAITWWVFTIVYREYIINKDINFLRTSYFTVPPPRPLTYQCNGWCIGHFFNYALLGFFAPLYAPLAIFLGALFEILEFFIEKRTKIRFVDAKIWQDIITNTAGTIFGYIISPLHK